MKFNIFDCSNESVPANQRKKTGELVYVLSEFSSYQIIEIFHSFKLLTCAGRKHYGDLLHRFYFSRYKSARRISETSVSRLLKGRLPASFPCPYSSQTQRASEDPIHTQPANVRRVSCNAASLYDGEKHSNYNRSRFE